MPPQWSRRSCSGSMSNSSSTKVTSTPETLASGLSRCILGSRHRDRLEFTKGSACPVLNRSCSGFEPESDGVPAYRPVVPHCVVPPPRLLVAHAESSATMEFRVMRLRLTVYAQRSLVRGWRCWEQTAGVHFRSPVLDADDPPRCLFSGELRGSRLL